jgi:uncharacterized protein (DUF427 family)
MATVLRKHLMSAIGELRVDPLQTRLRGWVGATPAVDSRATMLAWEPRRILPGYWVPDSDVLVDVRPSSAGGAEAPASDVAMMDGPPVLNPDLPFHVHIVPGTEYDLPGAPRAAFRPDDPMLAGGLLLDFRAFTRWQEEDEDVVGHPHDPFHRIDVRVATRQVEVRHAGTVLATSDRVHVLTETMLPVRYYFPRNDVRLDLMTRSDTSTVCAYKGTAAYFAVDGDDLAWTYEQPLHDALDVKDEIAFFNERVDLSVDGVQVERPRTPWSLPRRTPA